MWCTHYLWNLGVYHHVVDTAVSVTIKYLEIQLKALLIFILKCTSLSLDVVTDLRDVNSSYILFWVTHDPSSLPAGLSSEIVNEMFSNLKQNEFIVFLF